jgi:hypothetical protein
MNANTNEKSEVKTGIRRDLYAIAFFSIPCFIFSLSGWQNANGLMAKKVTSLQTARSKVISVDSDTINAANEGKLVYVKGMLKQRPEILTDPYFNVSTTAFALVRQVVKGDRNSAESLPYNPKLKGSYFQIPYPTMVWKTEETKLGAFDLTWDQVFPLFGLRTKKDDQDVSRLESIRKAAVLIPLTPELRDQLSSKWREQFVEDSKGWSIQLRDQYRTQVQFRQFALQPIEVSILAQQQGNGFVPYSLNDEKIFEIKIGNHDVESMFAIAQQRQMAKIYYAKGFYLFLFVAGLVAVLQVFVPRKLRSENKVEAMNSRMESSSDCQRGVLLDAEPFLLHKGSSRTYLNGEYRDIRRRFRLDNESAQPFIIFFALAVMFLIPVLLSELVKFTSPALRTPETERNIVGFFLLLIVAVYWILRKSETNSALDRMIRNGCVLKGTILSCTGKNTGNGEEYWYSVKVIYKFSNLQQIELVGECERDRDDLNGHPLPREGTAILVLYLDDNTYALL